MPQRSHHLLGIGAMAAAMLGFVTNDTLMKLAAEQIPLGEALFLRGVVSVALVFVLVAANRQRPTRRDYLDSRVIWRTIADVGATVVYLTALIHLPIANGTIVLQVVPLIVTMAGALLFHEHVGWRRWSAILVGLAGVVIVIRPGVEGFNIYSLLALSAVLMIAFRDIITRHVPERVPGMAIVVTAVVGNLLAGGAMAFGEEWQMPGAAALAYSVGAGVAIVFAYWFIVVALRATDLSLTAPFRYTIIVWAVIYGLVIWRDVPDFLTILGASLIVASGVFTLYRERRLAPDANKNKAEFQSEGV